MARDFLLTLTSVEVLAALKFTLLQAFISSVLCVLVALVAAPGYSGLGKAKKWVRCTLIFPQIVSTIFSVLGILSLFKSFPFGLSGVLIGNVFINAGLCILILGEKWEAIDRDWSRLAQLWGARSWFYYRKVVFPFLWPQMKSSLGIVFAFTLSSLVVPLVLGGGPASSTLELLIFEKIRTVSDVRSAIFISILQFFLEFIIFVILFKTVRSKSSKIKNTYLKIPFSVKTVLTCLVSFLLFLPYLFLVFSALQASWKQAWNEALISATGLSLLVALLVSLLIVVGIAFWNMMGSQMRWAFVPSVSSVIVGVAGFLLFRTHYAENFLLVTASLVLTHFLCFAFPVLRFVAEPLHEISRQYDAALKIYGGKFLYAMKKVFFPLGRRFYVQALLVAFCWSLGEYTVSAMVAPTRMTLPVYVQGLLGQYRLEEAAAASLLFFVIGIVASYVGESFFDGQA